MTIIRSRRFLKKFKTYEKNGREDILYAIRDVSNLLMTYDERSLYVLHKRYRDYKLKGNKKGMRELHLAQDDLLLYWIIKDDNTIVLEAMVSHEELRKRK